MNSLNRDTKPNEWEEELKIKQDKAFEQFQLSGAYDDSWQEDFIRTLLEEAKAKERKRCLDRIKKEVGIELSFVSQIAGHDNLTQMDMLSKSIAYLRVRDIIQSISAISNKKDND